MLWDSPSGLSRRRLRPCRRQRCPSNPDVKRRKIAQKFRIKTICRDKLPLSQYTNVFSDLVEGETDHPYEKPVSLIKRLLLNHSDVGDVVLDPFVGSGTMPVIAKTLGRRYIGIERENNYIEIARARINAAVPSLQIVTVEHARSGQPGGAREPVRLAISRVSVRKRISLRSESRRV